MLSEAFGNARSELPHHPAFGGDRLPEDVAHFIFHAPAMLARPALQPRLDVVLQFAHYQLSHVRTSR
jgi:hypothetical protein